jgi:hypothetical protein
MTMTQIAYLTAERQADGGVDIRVYASDGTYYPSVLKPEEAQQLARWFRANFLKADSITFTRPR